MTLSQCSFVDFVTSYAVDQPIFAGRPVNRTKIPQGESRHCHCKRTRSYVQKAAALMTATRALPPGSSIIPAYADRGLFLRLWKISLCTHVVHNDMQSAVGRAEKADGYSRSPDFLVKNDKFTIIDSKQR